MDTNNENRILLDATLGERLSDLRIRNDYTLKELSKILNLSSSMLSYIEHGERLPTMQTLLDYANHFSVDIENLIETRIVTIEKTFNKYGDRTSHHVANEYYLIAYFHHNDLTVKGML